MNSRRLLRPLRGCASHSPRPIRVDSNRTGSHNAAMLDGHSGGRLAERSAGKRLSQCVATRRASKGLVQCAAGRSLALRVLNVAAAALLLSGGCIARNAAEEPNDLPDASSRLTQIRSERLRGVQSWAIQLRGQPRLELEPIRTSAYDLVVIDYSADGTQAGEFSVEQIAALREGAGRPKIVLAYLSIGAAEIGRFYFADAWVTPDPREQPDGPFALTDAAPAFLLPTEADRADRGTGLRAVFDVRYLDPLWQQIVIRNPGRHPLIADAQSYLDRIIAAGFDGVYLDGLDAYQRFGPGEIGGSGERPDAAWRMIDLVLAIADHARLIRGRRDFLVISRNGAGIILPEAFPPEVIPAGATRAQFVAQCRAAYLEAIDGIGVEGVFYPGPAAADNPLAPQEALLALVDQYRTAGLLVLAIEYLTTAATIDEFYSQARLRGWTPYATTRDLSGLTVRPSQPP